MNATFFAEETLRFPHLDQGIIDAMEPFWDVITKVYRGKNDPIDDAVRRYFFPVRKVRIIPSLERRIDLSDIAFILYEKKVPNIYKKIHNTPIIVQKVKVESSNEVEESPF